MFLFTPAHEAPHAPGVRHTVKARPQVMASMFATLMFPRERA